MVFDKGALDDAGGQAINYPVDLLSQVAAKILVEASTALEQHQILWGQVQGFLRENDVDGKMEAVVGPHEKRMRDSYNWQMELASSLFSAIEAITQNEDALTKSFTSKKHGQFS